MIDLLKQMFYDLARKWAFARLVKKHEGVCNGRIAVVFNRLHLDGQIYVFSAWEKQNPQ